MKFAGSNFADWGQIRKKKKKIDSAKIIFSNNFFPQKKLSSLTVPSKGAKL